ncbi:MAG: hypothetical protein R3F65_13805 [bacterium]|nr:hypothetical protein [Myxococcales bacterium]MCB9542717.1 hypothetical protein [Myxococcales bacterium]MCB9552828.1 hypothetical protein [Myxococcales bacterium]
MPPARTALLVDLEADFAAEFEPHLARLGVGQVERATEADALSRASRLRPRVVLLAGGADPACRRALCRRLRQRTLAPIVVVVDVNGDDALAFAREPAVDACLVRAVGVAALAGQLPALLARQPESRRGRICELGREMVDTLRRYRLQRSAPPVRLVS